MDSGLSMIEELKVLLSEETPRGSWAAITKDFIGKNELDPREIIPSSTGAVQESLNILPAGVLGKISLLANVVFEQIDNSKKFEELMKEVFTTLSGQFERLEVLTRVFTNDAYIRQIPIELRDASRRHGKTLQEVTLRILDPEGPYIALYRMAEAAGEKPEAVRDLL